MEETLDFSQTQRIVFLIDLHPLFNHQNPNSNYISSVLASVRTLLNFSPLSNSLFAVKFFFSSLPPISSSSKLISLLGKSSLFFSFNRPEETLVSLSQTLDSLSNLSETLCLPPRASLIAISLRQLVHDYGWESRAQDLVGTSTVIRSNLVVLFSPVSRSIQCLSEFMGVEINDDDAFSGRFDGIFGSLSERFVSTDIHFSWIDVNFERESEEERVVKDESLLAVGLIERGVKRLGWGFCSTDAITLGSALVPFGLIYPKIGCSLMGTDYSRKVWVELSLSILDVNGNPLDCNCCNLELSDVKLLTKQSYKDISCLWESKKEITGDCHQVRATTNDVGDQVLKICVKEVWMNTENMKIKEGLCDFALLRGLSGGAVEDQTGKSSGDFFADKVLEMLRMESTEFTPGKPIWQVFLSFLYKRSYWALVFISDGNGLSLMGVLKPFTIHSAVLCIFDKQTSHNLVNDIDGLSSSLVHIVAKKYNKIPKADGELNHENKLTSSQDSKTKHKRKGSKVFQDLSWSSFCEAARNRCEMDLEEVYFARECRDSKKMRFLKCWIKQNTKSSRCLQIEPNESKSMPGLDDEMKKRLARRELDCEQSVSSSFSSEELSLTGSSPNKNEEATPAFCPETSETFFSCMSGRIEKGLDSKEIELGALAERLVNSSVYWLYRKHDESDNNAENPTSSERPKEDYNGSVAAELGELLLRDPKDLAAKYRSCEPPSLTLNPSPALNILEVKVREYPFH
ncbi:hypothetical protein GIB67_006341 [Kingdonia uniflora]|uniref:Uncharacterized protein n=1 Tax=Kingdonia uniflora TaxID=39325 RepID=A0A7J7P0K4_9MAGN|nr:hypothetical protein GIB67_006341 [Kingdonia uniflora]